MLLGGATNRLDPEFIEDVSSGAFPNTTGNLRLQRSSPAINGGINDGMPNDYHKDLDGLDRRANFTTVDIGAYENPFEGCSFILKVPVNYGLLNGMYRAAEALIVESGASIPSPNSVTFDAPNVEFEGSFDAAFGSSLTTLQDGCKESCLNCGEDKQIEE